MRKLRNIGYSHDRPKCTLQPLGLHNEKEWIGSALFGNLRQSDPAGRVLSDTVSRWVDRRRNLRELVTRKRRKETRRACDLEPVHFPPRPRLILLKSVKS